MPIHNIHDSGYKKLFSNRTFLRQLFETFVDEPWVKELDFDESETLDKSFVAEHYKVTESDLIHKVKLHGRDVYIYLLLEFQSSVDRFMVVCIAYYILAFYMDYLANRKRQKQAADAQTAELLPVVFPLLVYNGGDTWTAPSELAVVIEPTIDLGNYGVRCRYFPIAENSFSREQLLATRNLVSTLFLAEAHYDIELLIEEFVHLFEHEEDKGAVSLLINWFRQLMVHGRVLEQDYAALDAEYHSAQEVREMLIEAREREKEQLRDEGREEGIELGQKKERIAIVEQILQKRFGTLPTEATERLSRCTLEQLQILINPALDAPDLDTFFTSLPKSD